MAQLDLNSGSLAATSVLLTGSLSSNFSGLSSNPAQTIKATACSFYIKHLPSPQCLGEGGSYGSIMKTSKVLSPSLSRSLGTNEVRVLFSPGFGLLPLRQSNSFEPVYLKSAVKESRGGEEGRQQWEHNQRKFHSQAVMHPFPAASPTVRLLQGLLGVPGRREGAGSTQVWQRLKEGKWFCLYPRKQFPWP